MSIINRTKARADAAPTKENAQGAGNPEGAQINKSQQHDNGISCRLKALLGGIAKYDPALLALALIFALWPILALWAVLR